MGSGSYGGGGGGGSGSGVGRGGGGGAGGLGSIQFGGGVLKDSVVGASEVENDIKRILSNLPREYIQKQFCNPLIRFVYEQLFRLSVELFQNKSWSGVEKRYGVADQEGCLNRWANAVITQVQEQEPNQKIREVARSSLEDFLLLALDNDLDLFLKGTSKKVLQDLNQKIFDSTSAYFLSFMIWRIVEREKERLPSVKEALLRTAAQQRADRIVNSFKNKFYAKEQTTYRDLFRVLCENFDWFLPELRT
jgi:hypothetical protein